VYTDPDLVPFEPPARPLGLLGLRTLMRNYIETVPRSAYDQNVTHFRTWMSDVLIVSDPDIIQELLVDEAEAFGRDPTTRRSFAPIIGNTALFLAEGADWRWQRRAVAPIFRHETLLSFVPVFAAMAQRQVERWRKADRTVPTDAAAAMTRTTFEIIVEAMLGGSANLDADRYSRALTDNFGTIPWHIIYVMFSIPEWMPYPHRRRAMRSRDFLHRDIRRIVAARHFSQSSKPDLLNLMRAAHDPETGRTMSDDEIVANLLTFITAGHETTAVALTWALWLLAKDQVTQQRVFDEVKSVAADQPIDAASVEGLAFCRQVIQEAMRLFPPAPGIARISKAAVKIGNMQFSAGTRIHIPVFGIILTPSIRIALRRSWSRRDDVLPSCPSAVDRVSASVADLRCSRPPRSLRPSYARFASTLLLATNRNPWRGSPCVPPAECRYSLRSGDVRRFRHTALEVRTGALIWQLA